MILPPIDLGPVSLIAAIFAAALVAFCVLAFILAGAIGDAKGDEGALDE